MEMSQLRTFRAVAESLNFTRASERLNLTQSAVSHQIKALEEELGEPLFIRAKRGVKLSQAGKIALEYVERILDDTEALRETISGQERSQVGRVRVAAATQAFVHLFAPLFESFMDSHPGIDLAFRGRFSDARPATQRSSAARWLVARRISRVRGKPLPLEAGLTQQPRHLF